MPEGRPTAAVGHAAQRRQYSALTMRRRQKGHGSGGRERPAEGAVPVGVVEVLMFIVLSMFIEG
jgi:hypothetical protein